MAPALTIGPDDFGPAPGGSLIMPVVAGRFVPTVDMGVGMRRLSDFPADGVLLAAERGRPGQRYLLCAHNPTLKELVAEIAAVAGTRARTWHPAAVAAAPADRRPRLLVPDPWQRAAGTAHHREAHRPLRLVRCTAECAKTSAGDRSPCTRPWPTRCTGFGSTPRERAVHRGAGGEGMTTDTPAPRFEQARENVKPTGFAGSSGPEA